MYLVSGHKNVIEIMSTYFVCFFALDIFLIKAPTTTGTASMTDTTANNEMVIAVIIPPLRATESLGIGVAVGKRDLSC